MTRIKITIWGYQTKFFVINVKYLTCCPANAVFVAEFRCLPFGNLDIDMINIFSINGYEYNNTRV